MYMEKQGMSINQHHKFRLFLHILFVDPVDGTGYLAKQTQERQRKAEEE